LNGYLARHEIARGNDGLSYFKRSVMGAKDDVELKYLPWVVVDAMEQFFGFTVEDILANQVPRLPI